MATRTNFPVRIEKRRIAALARREVNVTRYTASGETNKLNRAKADVEGLKKKLQNKVG